MPTTSRKAFRYPANTDPVAQGATAIENLAEDVDGAWPTNPSTVSASDGGTISTADTWTTVVTGSAQPNPAPVAVVPASGRVLVLVSARLSPTVGTGLCSVGVRLNGAGLVNVDPAEQEVLRVGGVTGIVIGASRAYVVSGLTPAANLTATMVYKTSVNTTTLRVDDRRVGLVPLP